MTALISPSCTLWKHTAKSLLGAAALLSAANCSALQLQSGYQVISDVVTTTLQWTTGAIVPGNKPGWYYSQNLVPFLGYGQVGTILVSAAPLATGECINMYPMATYDGYRGYEIAPGILVIPFGTMSGPMVVTAGTMNPITTGGTFTPNSNPGLNTTSAVAWDKFGTGNSAGSLSTRTDCVGVGTTYTVSTGVVEMNTGGGTQAAIGYGVYVKPGAAKMATKDVYAQASRGYRWNATTSTFERRTFSLTWTGVSCNVSTPASISFGDVTPADVGKPGGIPVSSTLDVTCVNPTGTSLPVSYSVTPKSQAGDKNSVPLMSASKEISGDVRGFRGTTASADAGCTDKSSSVPMDGTKTNLRTITTETSWSDPLVWVLCPRAGAAPGLATAAVAIDLNW